MSFWPQLRKIEGASQRVQEDTKRFSAIVESLGEDVKAFREYFDFDDPDLAASLNHNFGDHILNGKKEKTVKISILS